MDLVPCLSRLLAGTVVAKVKVHGYHWNVVGPDFPQLHAQFATVYEDLDGSIDPIAEYLRALGAPAPARLSEYLTLSDVAESTSPADAAGMVDDSVTALESLLGCLVECFEAATEANQQGIANFIAGRIDLTQKWLWQLRVIVGRPFPPVDIVEPAEAEAEPADALAALAARLELAGRA